jgi:hypothetical protein
MNIGNRFKEARQADWDSMFEPEASAKEDQQDDWGGPQDLVIDPQNYQDSQQKQVPAPATATVVPPVEPIPTPTPVSTRVEVHINLALYHKERGWCMLQGPKPNNSSEEQQLFISSILSQAQVWDVPIQEVAVYPMSRKFTIACQSVDACETVEFK